MSPGPTLLRRASPLPALAAFLCVGAAALAAPADALWFSPEAKITREGGPIETLSALYYLAAAGALMALARLRAFWPAGFLLLAMALRELDADKRFTSEGLLGIKILTRETPLWEKVLALLVLATLLVAVATLLRRTWRPFLEALRLARPWACYIAAALALVFVSKSIDGLGRKLSGLGIEIAAATNRNAGVIEEVLELGIPILLLMAILARFGPAR